jgi:DNA-binding FadR family transcriptional regulator
MVSALMARIVSHGLQAGDMLPPEAILGAEFDVSRTVVREATKTLEAKGLVSVQQGRGSVVLPSDNWSILDAAVLDAQLEHDDGGRVFEDLTFLRTALESEMAAHAAERATLEMQRRMRDVLDRAEAQRSDPDAFLELDYAFHLLVMDASGNRIARAIMLTLEEPLHVARRLTNRIPGTIERGQQFHEEIFQAIIERDSAQARQTMRAHLESLWKALQRHEAEHSDGVAGPGDGAPTDQA